MPEATYPTPLHSVSYDSGPQYLRYLKRRKDWVEATLTSKYEDLGRDFNTSADDVPQYWELDYDGLDERDAAILDDFWDAHQIHLTFTFIEPRDEPWTGSEGDTVTGVRFDSYEANHDKVWIQSRKVVLVHYPT